MPVAYPLINGVRFDFSSIELRGPKGLRMVGIKGVNYSNALEPGDVYGTSAQMIGRTRGKYKAEADIEIYREDFDDLLNAIVTTAGGTSAPITGVTVPGYMEVAFDLIVTYAEIPASPPQTDIIQGCRIKKDASSHAQGTDALSIKIDLHPMFIIRNGKLPLNVPLR